MKYSNANRLFNLGRKYTKVLGLKSIFVLLLASCGHSSPNDFVQNPIQDDEEIKVSILPIRVGAERTQEYLPKLKGKKVGIVGNQSSLIHSTHLVDSLRSLGIDVVKVFSPEHGFRGDADAGEIVKSNIDKKTGIPIVSLYGRNKKPKQEQLNGIDILVFDIQDVGVRFYTYISTLHYVMEAAAEKKIPVLVLDRPNPNGHYIDGPVLEKSQKSFIGMHEVPVVYGMTIGEYGKMINGEGWLKNGLKCDYEVIPCQFYDRDMIYSLPVAPSPNLRTDISIQLYPSLCYLEATTVTAGRGTDGPFERFGHPDFPEEKTTFEFTPKPGYGSKDPKFNGKMCYGFNLKDSTKYERMNQLDLSFLFISKDLLKGKLFVDRVKTFNLLAGNSTLLKQINAGKSEDEIRASWQPKLNEFKKKREKYLLYD